MILCCGEALIDMLPRALESGEQVYLPVPGGAIFNTAIALGRLGEEAGFFSSLSGDMFGDQLAAALHASKVDTSLCVRSDQPSTLAFVKLTGGHAQYSFFDENSAGRSLSAADLPALPGNVAALHFGAISLIPEPCGSAYETLMADNRDRVLSLDPNIRPGFIKDGAAHRSRISRMIAMADIVKVSDEDLAWLLDGESDLAIVDEWLRGNTSMVLYTRGAAGVTVCLPGARFDFPARATTVVDTVGAGDTFNAGLLAGLRRQGLLDKKALAGAAIDRLAPAIELATQVAAFTCGRAGANPPWAAELTEA